ncbi:MAG: PD40 domain-containing protein [Ignavibacteria bacterium]|nr:PD40 domain-containing protein [Ignavibacteria bacterium]
MKKSIPLAVILIVCLFLTRCSTNDTTPITPTNNLSGYIYFENASDKIARIRLSDETVEDLFSNARTPDVDKNGRILCIKAANPSQVMFTDKTGANETPLIVMDGSGKFEYKENFYHPRLSYDLAYVSYEGVRDYSAVYVVDAADGSLKATIGDDRTGGPRDEPYISPSWAPDGSLYVAGKSSLNNGIYKFSPPSFNTPERIDPNLSNISEPSVSPDGKSIVFIKDSKVFTMGIDGSNPQQLNTGTRDFYLPVWSPDSKYIAAVSLGHIYVFDIIASTVTEINKTYYVNTNSQLCWK